MVSKKGLAVALSKLEVFREPSIKLEQYATESNIAAELLWHAYLLGRIEGKHVIDLGAGTGILAIGAAILGARVTAVEKDEKAAELMKKNIKIYEGTGNIRVIKGDVARFIGKGDVVVMNPPFGTKERHADRIFLEKATGIAPIIYTIHKSSTKNFVKAFCKEKGLKINWEEDREFPILRTMKHHRHDRQKVSVTLYCLEQQ